jgi:hypothetical protein
MKTPLLFLLSALASQLSAQTNILLNGSFESSSVGNLQGSFSTTGWTGTAPTSGGNAGFVSGPDNGLSPAAGNIHFAFNGGGSPSPGASWIQQSFATVADTTYTLTYSLGRAGMTGESLQARVAVTNGGSGGSTLGLWFDSPGASIGYTTMTHTFFATGTSATLRITDWSGNNFNSDMWLDNVRITSTSAIPEPSTYAALLGLSALVFTFWTRRSNRPPRAPSL